FQIAGTVGGKRVSAIHEGVHKNALQAILLRHLEKRIEMSLLRMNPAVGDESEQMKLPAAGARVLHGIEQHGVGEKLAILDDEDEWFGTQGRLLAVSFWSKTYSPRRHRGTEKTSPDYFNRITREVRIGCDDGQALFQSLGNQYAIERIAVMHSHLLEPENMI